MSTIHSAAPGVPGARRVRHQARESVAVMVVSAAMSVGLAVGLMLLASLRR
jgi:hypothetical protein